MKLLITGSTGFIGRNLKEQLENRYDIVSPCHKELDLLDTYSVEQFIKTGSFDVVIHTANINNTRNKKAVAYDVLNGNLHMFFNLERCKNYYGKMIYFGSGAEYDMNHYIPGMKEEYFGTSVPTDPYGFSKYIMSRTCEQNENIYDLRLFGVYGKYEEWERRFISNAICRVLKGMNITIQKNVYFDYLWIDDLCSIVQWFIENKPDHNHYNVCRGSKIDLYSLANMARKILNIACDIVVGEDGWKPEYTGDNTRLLKELGPYEFVTFEESIHKLCEYYKNHISIIDETQLI